MTKRQKTQYSFIYTDSLNILIRKRAFSTYAAITFPVEATLSPDVVWTSIWSGFLQIFFLYSLRREGRLSQSPFPEGLSRSNQSVQHSGPVIQERRHKWRYVIWDNTYDTAHINVNEKEVELILILQTLRTNHCNKHLRVWVQKLRGHMKRTR